MQNIKTTFSLLIFLCFFNSPIFAQNNMRWIELDTISPDLDIGTCGDMSSCDGDKRVKCFALVYEPSYSLEFTSYTTFFRIDCAADNEHSLVYNESCIMTDNSTVTQACPAIEQRFNSSANTGTVMVDSGANYVIHQVCVQVAIGDTVVLEIREPPAQNVQSNCSLGYGQETQTENLDVEDLVVIGDPCEIEAPQDIDEDGVVDSLDNCVNTPNSAQIDTDLDGIGNACDDDDDNDGCLDINDEEPLIASLDSDCDGIGDDCDICPGVDDQVDYNEDNIPDCSQLLAISEYSPDWLCANNKVSVCKNGVTKCKRKRGLARYFNRGGIIGPCIDCDPFIPEEEQESIEQRSIVSTDLGTKLYPNPARNEIFVSIPNDYKVITEFPYRIFAIDGKLVSNGQVALSKAQSTVQIDLNNELKGRYFVQIILKNKVITKSFVVAN